MLSWAYNLYQYYLEHTTTFINVIKGVQLLLILSRCTITSINVIRHVQPLSMLSGYKQSLNIGRGIHALSIFSGVYNNNYQCY